MKPALHFAATLAVMVGAGLAISHAASDLNAQAASWQLVGELRGEAYVMDYGLTASDCLDALNSERPRWGSDVSLTCEREG